MGQSSGGLAHYTAELANNVAEHAEVIVVKPTTSVADDLFNPEVEVIDLFAPLGVSMPDIYKLTVNPVALARGILSYDNLERVREIDADVTHDATGLFPQVKLFAKRHGVDEVRPFVVTFHEVPMNRFSLSRPPVLVEETIKATLPDLRIARSVVHTPTQKRALVKDGVPPEDVEVIPHGAYSIFGDPATVDGRTEPNTLLFFGNVVPPKGLDTLVEAVPHVAREVPDVTLVVAGDGKIPRASKRIIDAYPEHFDVRNYFVPNEEVGELFAKSTVVVLPYRSQDGAKGHSGALSAAFSFGKPVVATTAGDFVRQVAETGCGLTVPPDDPRRLARAIVSVLTDDSARERMAANSDRMGDRLSWENVSRRYMDVYRRIW